MNQTLLLLVCPTLSVWFSGFCHRQYAIRQELFLTLLKEGHNGIMPQGDGTIAHSWSLSLFIVHLLLSLIRLLWD